MGQKERLSEVEKGKILAFKETGLSNRAIAKKIDRLSGHIGIDSSHNYCPDILYKI